MSAEEIEVTVAASAVAAPGVRETMEALAERDDEEQRVNVLTRLGRALPR